MQTQPMVLATDAIGPSGLIDSRYTCDLDNSSPELRWNHVPLGALGFVIIAEDIDAPSGVFTHWIIYNIPSDVHHLPAGIPPQESLPNGIKQGINSFGKLGYSGPCPPSGDPAHRYFFQLFALSEMPRASYRIERADLFRQFQSHILAQATVSGLYRRAIQRAG